MLNFSKLARSMSVWNSLTPETAWPLINEIKNNLHQRSDSYYAYNFLHAKPNEPAPDAREQTTRAISISLFLQSQNIKAVLNSKEGVIVFTGFERHDKDAKNKIISLLDALEPKKPAVGLAEVIEKPKVGLAEIAPGCSLKNPLK